MKYEKTDLLAYDDEPIWEDEMINDEDMMFDDETPMLKPGEEMMMSESEICFRFRRNGCCSEHIEILAQLNAVYPNTIAEILYRNGLYEFDHYIYNPEREEWSA